VGEILQASDVLVHPTRIDAFPTALLEAAAAALPVIATDVGGVPEIVSDGETGLLLTPPPDAQDLAAALTSVLADPDLRRRLGVNARQDFERRFTAERWADQLRGVYDDVRAGRPSRRGSRVRQRS
jgi:glycosyltransferase involved in cell wall biosynthesis